MKAKKLPFLNDPIYGFIHIASPLIFELLEHAYFQRLRRIAQMGLSSLVFPGARHSRFEHALGAMHLMNLVVESLRKKGIKISAEEQEAMAVAILLHDIGHGPFSHALEEVICLKVHHESLSLALMQQLNLAFNGRLELAISIYQNTYPRAFMHQLVSSQLDVDRLDYLKRDSFYTGATEGNINTQRIVEMFHVVDDKLVVEEKGLFSVEKFLMARRLMYWQVYLHKTGLAAELLLANLMRYVREKLQEEDLPGLSPALHFFMTHEQIDVHDPAVLNLFSQLDDTDILFALKTWQSHADPILANYAQQLLHRRLMKVKFADKAFSQKQVDKKRAKLIEKGSTAKFAESFVFAGKVKARPYNLEEDPIVLLKKSGKTIDLQEHSSLFKGESFSHSETKHYLCFAKSL